MLQPRDTEVDFLKAYTRRATADLDEVADGSTGSDAKPGLVNEACESLLYNPHKDCVLLTRQFRLPAYLNGGFAALVEAPAGLEGTFTDTSFGGAVIGAAATNLHFVRSEECRPRTKAAEALSVCSCRGGTAQNMTESVLKVGFPRSAWIASLPVEKLASIERGSGVLSISIQKTGLGISRQQHNYSCATNEELERPFLRLSTPRQFPQGAISALRCYKSGSAQQDEDCGHHG
ncbi:NUDIX hydrolase [Pseudooceanicola spongiae]|uniref:hypothetical protein n=1 Tax=Pseudooceanicola spongiae TaxID=2613965 RepID=UPI001D0191B9|nr:hypothetical protein [Pseudooceanicola spongiae]